MTKILIPLIIIIAAAAIGLLYWADPDAARHVRDDVVRWVRERFDA